MTIDTLNQPHPGGRRLLSSIPLGPKLVIAFVLVAVIPAVLLTYIGTTAASSQLTEQLGKSVHERTDAIARTLANEIDREFVSSLQIVSLNKLIQDRVAIVSSDYPETETEISSYIINLDSQWVSARDNDPLVISRLRNDLASELIEFQSAFPYHKELFITDRYGTLVAATQRTTDFYQADEEWWQAAWNEGQGQVFISQPLLDENAGVVGIQVAVPIYAHSERIAGELLGVLHSTVDFAVIAQRLEELELAHIDLLFPDGTAYEPDEGRINETDSALLELVSADGKHAERDFARITHEGIPLIASVASFSEFSDVPYIQNLAWTVIASEDEATVLESIQAELQQELLPAVIILIIVVLAALAFARSIAVPVRRLANITQRFAEGDFSQRVALGGRDEIGALSSAFNIMADQLQGLVGSLEERVTARTRDLQTVADVVTEVATVLEPERLLRDVADLTKERFGLYHSHIYLLNDTGDTLVLTAGAGYIGRQMVSEHRTIAYENPQSIVAQAARSRKAVIVDDVRQSPTFLPHRLLPDTRSEMAVPLVARGQLLGVLDVQSNQAGYFDENSLATFNLMAGQISAAISNAQLYATAERTSRHERALSQIDHSIQSANSMDEILQATVRELGKALRVPYTAIELELDSEADSEPT